MSGARQAGQGKQAAPSDGTPSEREGFGGFDPSDLSVYTKPKEGPWLPPKALPRLPGPWDRRSWHQRRLDSYHEISALPVEGERVLDENGVERVQFRDESVVFLHLRIEQAKGILRLARKGKDEELFERAYPKLAYDYDSLATIFKDRGDRRLLGALRMHEYRTRMEFGDFARAEELKRDLSKALGGHPVERKLFEAAHALATWRFDLAEELYRSAKSDIKRSDSKDPRLGAIDEVLLRGIPEGRIEHGRATRQAKRIAMLEFVGKSSWLYGLAEMAKASGEDAEVREEIEGFAAEGRPALVAKIKEFLEDGVETYDDAVKEIEQRSQRELSVQRGSMTFREMRKHGYRRGNDNPFHWTNLLQVARGDGYFARIIEMDRKGGIGSSPGAVIEMAQWARREGAYDLAGVLLEKVKEGSSKGERVWEEAEGILQSLKGEGCLSDRGADLLAQVGVEAALTIVAAATVGGALARGAVGLMRLGGAAAKGRDLARLARVLGSQSVQKGVGVVASAQGMTAARLGLNAARGRAGEGYVEASIRDLTAMLALSGMGAIFGRAFAAGAEKELRAVRWFLQKVADGKGVKREVVKATEEMAALTFGRPLAALSDAERMYLVMTGPGRAAYRGLELGLQAEAMVHMQALEVAFELCESCPSEKNLGHVTKLLAGMRDLYLIHQGNVAGGRAMGRAVRALSPSGEALLVRDAMKVARELFGFRSAREMTPEALKKAYKAYARAHHADMGGDGKELGNVVALGRILVRHRSGEPLTAGEAKVLGECVEKIRQRWAGAAAKGAKVSSSSAAQSRAADLRAPALAATSTFDFSNDAEPAIVAARPARTTARPAKTAAQPATSTAKGRAAAAASSPALAPSAAQAKGAGSSAELAIGAAPAASATALSPVGRAAEWFASSLDAVQRGMEGREPQLLAGAILFLSGCPSEQLGEAYKAAEAFFEQHPTASVVAQIGAVLACAAGFIEMMRRERRRRSEAEFEALAREKQKKPPPFVPAPPELSVPLERGLPLEGRSILSPGDPDAARLLAKISARLGVPPEELAGRASDSMPHLFLNRASIPAAAEVLDRGIGAGLPESTLQDGVTLLFLLGLTRREIERMIPGSDKLYGGDENTGLLDDGRGREATQPDFGYEFDYKSWTGRPVCATETTIFMSAMGLDRPSDAPLLIVDPMAGNGRPDEALIRGIARSHPRAQLIGLDLNPKSLRMAASEAREAGIDSTRLAYSPHNALDPLPVPPGSVDRIVITGYSTAGWEYNPPKLQRLFENLLPAIKAGGRFWWDSDAPEGDRDFDEDELGHHFVKGLFLQAARQLGVPVREIEMGYKGAFAFKILGAKGEISGAQGEGRGGLQKLSGVSEPSKAGIPSRPIEPALEPNVVVDWNAPEGPGFAWAASPGKEGGGAEKPKGPTTPLPADPREDFRREYQRLLEETAAVSPFFDETLPGFPKGVTRELVLHQFFAEVRHLQTVREILEQIAASRDDAIQAISVGGMEIDYSREEFVGALTARLNQILSELEPGKRAQRLLLDAMVRYDIEITAVPPEAIPTGPSTDFDSALVLNADGSGQPRHLMPLAESVPLANRKVWKVVSVDVGNRTMTLERGDGEAVQRQTVVVREGWMSLFKIGGSAVEIMPPRDDGGSDEKREPSPSSPQVSVTPMTHAPRVLSAESIPAEATAEEPYSHGGFEYYRREGRVYARRSGETEWSELGRLPGQARRPKPHSAGAPRRKPKRNDPGTPEKGAIAAPVVPLQVMEGDGKGEAATPSLARRAANWLMDGAATLAGAPAPMMGLGWVLWLERLFGGGKKATAPQEPQRTSTPDLPLRFSAERVDAIVSRGRLGVEIGEGYEYWLRTELLDGTPVVEIMKKGADGSERYRVLRRSGGEYVEVPQPVLLTNASKEMSLFKDGAVYIEVRRDPSDRDGLSRAEVDRVYAFLAGPAGLPSLVRIASDVPPAVEAVPDGSVIRWRRPDARLVLLLRGEFYPIADARGALGEERDGWRYVHRFGNPDDMIRIRPEGEDGYRIEGWPERSQRFPDRDPVYVSDGEGQVWFVLADVGGERVIARRDVGIHVSLPGSGAITNPPQYRVFGDGGAGPGSSSLKGLLGAVGVREYPGDPLALWQGLPRVGGESSVLGDPRSVTLDVAELMGEMEEQGLVIPRIPVPYLELDATYGDHPVRLQVPNVFDPRIAAIYPDFPAVDPQLLQGILQAMPRALVERGRNVTVVPMAGHANQALWWAAGLYRPGGQILVGVSEGDPEHKIAGNLRHELGHGFGDSGHPPEYLRRLEAAVAVAIAGDGNVGQNKYAEGSWADALSEGFADFEKAGPAMQRLILNLMLDPAWRPRSPSDAPGFGANASGGGGEGAPGGAGAASSGRAAEGPVAREGPGAEISERHRAAMAYILPQIEYHLAALVQPPVSLTAAEANEVRARLLRALEERDYSAFRLLARRARITMRDPDSQEAEIDRILGSTAAMYMERFRALVEGTPMDVSLGYIDLQTGKFPTGYRVKVTPELLQDGRFVVGKIALTAMKLDDATVTIAPAMTPPAEVLKRDFGLEVGAPLPLDMVVKKISPDGGEPDQGPSSPPKGSGGPKGSSPPKPAGGVPPASPPPTAPRGSAPPSAPSAPTTPAAAVPLHGSSAGGKIPVEDRSGNPGAKGVKPASDTTPPSPWKVEFAKPEHVRQAGALLAAGAGSARGKLSAPAEVRAELPGELLAPSFAMEGHSPPPRPAGNPVKAMAAPAGRGGDGGKPGDVSRTREVGRVPEARTVTLGRGERGQTAVEGVVRIDPALLGERQKNIGRAHVEILGFSAKGGRIYKIKTVRPDRSKFSSDHVVWVEQRGRWGRLDPMGGDYLQPGQRFALGNLSSVLKRGSMDDFSGEQEPGIDESQVAILMINEEGRIHLCNPSLEAAAEPADSSRRTQPMAAAKGAEAGPGATAATGATAGGGLSFLDAAGKQHLLHVQRMPEAGSDEVLDLAERPIRSVHIDGGRVFIEIETAAEEGLVVAPEYLEVPIAEARRIGLVGAGGESLLREDHNYSIEIPPAEAGPAKPEPIPVPPGAKPKALPKPAVQAGAQPGGSAPTVVLENGGRLNGALGSRNLPAGLEGYSRMGRLISLVGVVPGLTPEMEADFRRGYQVYFQSEIGKPIFVQHAKGLVGETQMREVVAPEVLRIYEAWQQRAGFAPLPEGEAQKHFEGLRDFLKARGIPFKPSQTGEFAPAFGRQYGIIHRLLALCPEAHLRPVLRGVEVGGMRVGAGRAGSADGSVVRIYEAFTHADRVSFQLLVAHEIGHTIEQAMLPEQRERLQADLRRILAARALIVAESSLESRENREFYISEFKEFIAEMNAQYVLAGDYLSAKIAKIADPAARRAYEEVYLFFKAFYDGREFTNGAVPVQASPSSPAPVPKPEPAVEELADGAKTRRDGRVETPSSTPGEEGGGTMLEIEGRKIPVAGSRVVIGGEHGASKSPVADIVVPNPRGYVSKRHAAIFRGDDGTWCLRALSTVNRTAIRRGGQEIEVRPDDPVLTPLENGDVIILVAPPEAGGAAIVFHAPRPAVQPVVAPGQGGVSRTVPGRAADRWQVALEMKGTSLILRRKAPSFSEGEGEGMVEGGMFAIRRTAGGRYEILDRRDPRQIEEPAERLRDFHNCAVDFGIDRAPMKLERVGSPDARRMEPGQWHEIGEGDTVDIGGFLYLFSARAPSLFGAWLEAHPSSRSVLTAVRDTTHLLAELEKIEAGEARAELRTLRECLEGRTPADRLSAVTRDKLLALMEREAEAYEQVLMSDGIQRLPRLRLDHPYGRLSEGEQRYHAAREAWGVTRKIAASGSADEVAQILEASPFDVASRSAKALRQVASRADDVAFLMETINGLSDELGSREKLWELLFEQRPTSSSEATTLRPDQMHGQIRVLEARLYDEIGKKIDLQGGFIASSDGTRRSAQEMMDLVHQVLERGLPLQFITSEQGIRDLVERHMRAVWGLIPPGRRPFNHRNYFTGESFKDFEYTADGTPHSFLSPQKQYRFAVMMIRWLEGHPIFGAPTSRESQKVLDFTARAFGVRTSDHREAQRILQRRLDRLDDSPEGRRAQEAFRTSDPETQALVVANYFMPFWHRRVGDPARAFLLARLLGDSLYREIGMGLDYGAGSGDKPVAFVSFGDLSSVRVVRRGAQQFLALHTHPAHARDRQGQRMGAYAGNGKQATIAFEAMGNVSKDFYNIFFSEGDIEVFLGELPEIAQMALKRDTFPIFKRSGRQGVYRNWVASPHGASVIRINVEDLPERGAGGRISGVEVRFAIKPEHQGVFANVQVAVAAMEMKRQIRQKLRERGVADDVPINLVQIGFEEVWRDESR